MSLEVQGASSEGKGSDWKERKRILVSKLQELASEIVTDPEKLKAFAERWRGGFRCYSLYNLMLIWCQNGKATLCAGYQTWRKHGRFVMAGEKAIYILAPAIVPVKGQEDKTEEEQEKCIRYFFPVPVFDYGQTGGQELLIGNTQVSGNGDVDIKAIADGFNLSVKYSQGTADGWTDGKGITISKRENKAQEIACFFHELAHCLLNHANERNKGDISFLSRERWELEAEATAFLVCSCLGIDNEGSRFYLGNWKGDKDKLGKSALRILSCAEKILRKAKPEAFKDKLPVEAN